MSMDLTQLSSKVISYEDVVRYDAFFLEGILNEKNKIFCKQKIKYSNVLGSVELNRKDFLWIGMIFL